MSARLLREAASLMRERAEAATPGPWIAEYSKPSGHCVIDAESGNCLDSVARATHFRDGADAAHIASWHPAVALAVADWLEDAAQNLDMQAPGGDLHRFWDMRVHIAGNKALAVARAYLGRDA